MSGVTIKQLLCQLCSRLICDHALPVQELQNDLEAEQVKVNSLTHMVVVVDENSGESATAALEEQLQVCRQPDADCVIFSTAK